MKKKFISINLKIKHLILSIKQIKEVHLMDDVIYDGKKCFVNNGRHYPKWDLLEIEWNADGTRNHYLVHENDFKKVHSFHNFKNDMLHHYKWWKNCWYEIELNQKLKELNR